MLQGVAGARRSRQGTLGIILRLPQAVFCVDLVGACGRLNGERSVEDRPKGASRELIVLQHSFCARLALHVFQCFLQGVVPSSPRLRRDKRDAMISWDERMRDATLGVYPPRARRGGYTPTPAYQPRSFTPPPIPRDWFFCGGGNGRIPRFRGRGGSGRRRRRR